MNKVTVYIVLMMIAMFSCVDQKQKEKKEVKELYDQVMESHDFVMPEMGALVKLAKQLKSQADSLAIDSDLSGAATQSEINRLVKDLDDANESMMQWMRDFEPTEEGTPHGEVIQYLTEQKKSIDKVKEDMLSAKANAEKYILENN